MEKQATLAALAALSQETRLDIFRLLVEAGPEGRAVGRIGEALDLPSATLSFHLKELKHAGLVTVQREGRSLIYSADFREPEFEYDLPFIAFVRVLHRKTCAPRD